MLKRAIVCSALLAAPILMGQSPGQRAYDETLRKANIDMMRIVYKPLEAFEREDKPRCNSENLRSAMRMAVGLAESLNSDQRFQSRFDAKLAAGIGIADVGDAAKRRRCGEQARAMYDLILEVYVGLAYAGLRQRAQIGIDDLRAAKR